MADIRINSLPTTASASSSDDFLALDGATNGTRKLNAFSPTFGGNLTVSGTGTSSFAGLVKATGNAATSFGVEIANGAGFSGTAQYYLTAGNGAGFTAFRLLRGNGAAGYEDNGFNADSFSGARFNLNALGGSGGNFTISGGNLTVSGGTITGGTSGMSLAAGGTNQNITLTPSGTGRSNAYGSIPSSAWAANDLDSSFNAGLVVGPRGTGSSFGVSTASASSGYPSGLLVDGSYAATNSTVNIKAVGVYSGGGYGASLAFQTSSNTTLSEVGRFTKAGNFLVGTTTDGGQKLQVSGTAAFTSTVTVASNFTISSNGFYAGGGTPGAGRLLYSASAGTMLCGQAGSTYDLSLATSGGTTVLGIPTGTTNATFAGTVTAQKLVGTGVNDTTSAADIQLTGRARLVVGLTGTSANYYDANTHYFRQGDGAAAALTLSASTATFAGSIAIGNTVNTVSPTSPNRTITMVIGGTTYYIHAKTTND